jgi:hypothetical protein
MIQRDPVKVVGKAGIAGAKCHMPDVMDAPGLSLLASASYIRIVVCAGCKSTQAVEKSRNGEG